MAQFKEKINNQRENLSAIFIIVLMGLFILAGFVSGFVLPLYLLALLFGFVVSVLYPRSGLFAVVFLTIIFERFFTLQSFFIRQVEYKLYPLDVLLGGIIIGILLEIFIHKKEVKFKKVDFWLIAFIFLNIIYFIASAFFLNTSLMLAVSIFKNYAFYSLLYFISVFLIRTETDLKNFFKFFFAGAVGVIVFLLLGILRGQGIWSEFTPLSTEGVRILAFPHGLYLSLFIFPAISHILFRNKRSNKLLFSLILIWIFGIAGTMMRHLWISLVATAVVVYFFLSGNKRAELRKIFSKISILVIFTGAFIFYGISMLPPSNLAIDLHAVTKALSNRVLSLANVEADESFSWRGLVWKSAFEEYRRNPLFGIGTGRTVYVEEGEYRDFIEIKNIHNSYLTILFQFGLLGFGAFLALVVIILKKLIQSLNAHKLSLYKFSVLGMMLLFLFSFPFQPYLETNLLALFFWLTLGIARNLSEDEIISSRT